MGADRITRRRLIAAGASTAIAAYSLDWSVSQRAAQAGADAAPQAAGTPMRKLVSLGGSRVNKAPGAPNDYRNVRNRQDVFDTGTKWVKIWVSMYEAFIVPDAPLAGQGHDFRPGDIRVAWDRLANGIPPSAATGGHEWGLGGIDQQVRAANEDGVGVILCLDWRHPLWASHPPEASVFAQGDPELAVGPRGEKANWRFPSDLGPESPWAWFVSHLFARYALGTAPNPSGPRIAPDGAPSTGNAQGAYVDFVEICNEPNLFPWPQGEGGANAIAATVQMFKTAEEHAVRFGTAILGPGTADLPARNDTALTEYAAFTGGVAAGLKGWRPRVSVGWSHHNYTDIREGSTERYATVCEILTDEGWYDRKAQIWLTEGGLDLGPSTPAVSPLEADQARLIATGWAQFQALSDRCEAGGTIGQVYAFGQHTLEDEPFREAVFSLRRPAGPLGEAEGEPRPAYAVWRGLPGNATAH